MFRDECASSEQIGKLRRGKPETPMFDNGQVLVTNMVDNPAVSVNHLPNEILVEIFSYLSIEDLGLSVQFVCKRWSELSSHDVLWKNSVFTVNNVQSPEYISSFLESVPKLKCIRMYKPTAELINRIANYTKNLCELILVDLCDVPSSKEALKNLFTESKNLQDITLPGEILTSSKLAELVGQLLYVRTISLRGISLEPIVLKPLADGCPLLEHLDIDKMNWVHSDMKYFLQKKEGKLLSLRISNCPFDADLCVLPLVAMYGNALQKLQLDILTYNFSPVTFSNIKKLSNLTSLEISHPRGLTADLIANVFSGKALSKLVELKIEAGGSEVDSMVVNTICHNCPNLLKLSLKACYSIQDDALQYLNKCSNLKHLNLFCCLDLKGGATEHIFKCKNLKYLDIGPWIVINNVLGHLMFESELKHFHTLYCKTPEICVNLSHLRLRWQRQYLTENM